MNILICGGYGFIGSALVVRLAQRGHHIVRGARLPIADDDVAIDFSAVLTTSEWRARLKGIDAVVNATGILHESADQSFEAIHRDSPIGLFDTCCRAGVRHIIQISALGAATGDTAYFTSKRAADDYLQMLPVRHHIVRPALVYGRNGASAKFFRMLASMPVHVLPAGGNQFMRPVHIDDLTDVVSRLLDADHTEPRIVDVVGAREVTYREMLGTYRSAMGLPPAIRLNVPGTVVATCARMAGTLRMPLLSPDTWRMFQAGNTASAASVISVLERHPQDIRRFINEDAGSLRREALAMWQPLVLRFALAAVWIWTAIVSAFVQPISVSLDLLGRVHLTGAIALAALYASATLDFVLGIATIVRPSRRLWLGQGALIAMYTAILVTFMPQMLADAFGPLLKNLPILAILMVLYNEDAHS
ncbi:SDR family oxidoreductase [Caballeronia sp. BR00000012568055]|uniref:SDR family oxidoreductase n=1 Tax=Caballeronia sp. BR00000012568055 TaxID=2918761 RepID=UPI0023F9F3AC|nr:SDR family oxidoreductase [Caballeronia sp. BR00000012568055]